jgi:hypothetical protein
MGYEDTRLILQVGIQAVVDDELPHMHVYGTDGVIQQVDVTLTVQSSGQRDTGFLASREVHSLLAYYRLIPLHEDLNILL